MISDSKCQVALGRISAVLHCMILFLLLLATDRTTASQNWKSKMMFVFWEHLPSEKWEWSQPRLFLNSVSWPLIQLFGWWFFFWKSFNSGYFGACFKVGWFFWFFLSLPFLSTTHCDFSALHSKVLFFVCVVQEKICIESEWNVWSAFCPQLACDEALTNCSMLFNINF